MLKRINTLNKAYLSKAYLSMYMVEGPNATK